MVLQQKKSSDHGVRRDLIVIDGGTGTEILRRGGPFRRPEWSALALYENPPAVKRVHDSFIASGASHITTDTYAIIPFHLGTERYKKDAKWLLKLAVDLALEARGESNSNARVLGSIPPVCGSYAAERFDEDVALPIVRDFLEAFRSRVDTILFETQGSIDEVSFYLQQLQYFQMDCMPVWISFCLKPTADDKPLLRSGETLTEAASSLKHDNWLASDGGPVSSILVNCCDVQLVGPAVEELRSALPPLVRVGAYPNAYGDSPKNPTSATEIPNKEKGSYIAPKCFAKEATQWSKLGANVLGGCCGIGPEHIQELCKLKQEAR